MIVTTLTKIIFQLLNSNFQYYIFRSENIAFKAS